jgi:hypothetical protein
MGFMVHQLQKDQGVRGLSCSSRIGQLWMRARDQAAADASGPSANDPTARVVCTRRDGGGHAGGRRCTAASLPEQAELEL